jgi:hypothetical protein
MNIQKEIIELTHKDEIYRKQLIEATIWSDEYTFVRGHGISKRTEGELMTPLFHNPEHGHKTRWRMCGGTVEGKDYDHQADCCTIF